MRVWGGTARAPLRGCGGWDCFLWGTPVCSQQLLSCPSPTCCSGLLGGQVLLLLEELGWWWQRLLPADCVAPRQDPWPPPTPGPSQHLSHASLSPAGCEMGAENPEAEQSPGLPLRGLLCAGRGHPGPERPALPLVSPAGVRGRRCGGAVSERAGPPFCSLRPRAQHPPSEPLGSCQLRVLATCPGLRLAPLASAHRAAVGTPCATSWHRANLFYVMRRRPRGGVDTAQVQDGPWRASGGASGHMWPRPAGLSLSLVSPPGLASGVHMVRAVL